jgi:dimethylaniline monooxygenase (N-oxide forming)
LFRKGIYGLITAKTLLHDSDSSFDSVVLYEKSAELGGVWAPARTYKGLTTNSPLLTYEIPGFLYPKASRKVGKHVPAEEVHTYLQAYANQYNLIEKIKFSTVVKDISWNPSDSNWTVQSESSGDISTSNFSHIVVCTGLYHAKHLSLDKDQTATFNGNVWHSSDISSAKVQETLGTSKNVVIIGAGKSAIDIATIIAQGRFSAQTADSTPPAVKLVYRKPHWLSPRKILRRTIPFEKLLFSRFVVSSFSTPKYFQHRLIF